MKLITALLTLSTCSAIFAQPDSTKQLVEEDPILEKIQIDEPAEPILRFGTHSINLFGRWCFDEADSNSFILRKKETPREDCLEVSFGYWGYFGEQRTMNGALVAEKTFSILDSTLSFYYEDGSTRSYIVTRRFENELILSKPKTALPIVPTEKDDKQGFIPVMHQFKNKSAELALERIFELTVDSIDYFGEVEQLTDSMITFHAYQVGWKINDSVYRFPLDSVTELGYYFGKHYERYFTKHVRSQPKHADEVEDFFRVTRYIGGAAIIYTLISGIPVKSYEGDPALTTGADPVIMDIGLYTLIANAGYVALQIFRQLSTRKFYNLEDDWQIVHY